MKIELEIPEKLLEKVEAISPLIDRIADREGKSTIENNIIFLLEKGVMHPIKRVTPNEDILEGTLIAMFSKRPEFVVGFIEEVLEDGKDSPNLAVT